MRDEQQNVLIDACWIKRAQTSQSDRIGAIVRDGIAIDRAPRGRPIATNTAMFPNFEATLMAFADTIVRKKQPIADRSAHDAEAVARFLSTAHAQMPDYLRLPFRILTLIFDAWPIALTGKPFHRLPLERRSAQVAAWENSRIELRRRLMEFYGSLALFCLYSEIYFTDYHHD